VNWEKVATALNYKSGSVASIRFNQIKKKMESSLDGPASAGSGTEANTPTKGPKPKANKVTKAPAKTRTPRKGVACPVKKGAKEANSAEKITKEEDSGLDDDMELDHDNEASPVPKLEFNHEKFLREIDEADYEQVSTRQLPLIRRLLTLLQ
jgi:hypothetical protein